MTQSKHTPGPWMPDGPAIEQEDGSEARVVRVRRGDRLPVLALVLHMPGSYRLERDANARLIAAAPEMLDGHRAVVELADWWDSEEGEAADPWERVRRLKAVAALSRAAIRKATGGEG